MNKYYEQLKTVIDATLLVIDDGKITMSEVWMFMLVLGEAIQTILGELSNFDEQDLIELQAAAVALYDDYVLPLDLPGPDVFFDPLLRNGILPGLVEGAFRLASDKTKTN